MLEWNRELYSLAGEPHQQRENNLDIFNLMVATNDHNNKITFQLILIIQQSTQFVQLKYMLTGNGHKKTISVEKANRMCEFFEVRRKGKK